MKFACFSSQYDNYERLTALQQLGYHGVELPLTGFSEVSAETAIEYKKYLDSIGLCCVGFNGMFPKEIRLVGPEYDRAKTVAYAEKAFYLASLTGAKVVTLGSGGARHIPDTMSHAEAEEQLISVLMNDLVPIAEKNGLLFAIEPLRITETNFLNNCREIKALIEKSGSDKIFITLDQYQSYMGGDTNADIVECGDLIVHTHIASTQNDRYFPSTTEDIEELKGFFAALDSIGYDGALCIEARTGDSYSQSADNGIKAMRAARAGE